MPGYETKEDLPKTDKTPVYFDRNPDDGGPWQPTK